MPEKDDLLEELKHPDTRDAAFHKLVSEYKERLYWHIRKILLLHEDTDDVLQNTFIKVFRHIDGFKGESKLYSWMYRIATNEALDHLKRKANRMHVDISEMQEKVVKNLESDTYFDGESIQLKLQEAIVKLPQRQQIVFNMRYFDGMKYEEMAGILEVSVGSLKASYHHAKKKVETYIRESQTIVHG